jgi:hypothetical protein
VGCYRINSGQAAPSGFAGSAVLTHVCRQSMNSVALHDAARPCCNGDGRLGVEEHIKRGNPAVTDDDHI